MMLFIFLSNIGFVELAVRCSYGMSLPWGRVDYGMRRIEA